LRFQLVLISFLLICCGCFSQSGSSAADSALVNRRIEQKVRSTFQLPPSIDVKVGTRGPSEMPGYDKVPVSLSSDRHTSTHDFLVSKDNKTIIEWEKLDISHDVMDSIDTHGRPERGNKDAKVTIVSYDDFQCPFCSRMHQTLFPDLFKAYGDRVKIIYKDYPLIDLHPWAMHAAVDANCLAAQNADAFWDFADYTHANQKSISGEKRDIQEEYARLDKLTTDLGAKHNLRADELQACVKKQDETTVRTSLAEGEKLGIDATPTIFINGEEISGILPEAELRAVIDRALRDAGQTPPATTPAQAPSAALAAPRSGSQ